MNKMIPALAIAAAFVVTSVAQAAEKNTATTANSPIKQVPYTAIYQAVYRTFPLQATHRLQQSGNGWSFSSVASGFFGQIEENSTFTFSGNRIVPLHYLYHRSVLGQDRETELLYNQKDKVMAGSKGNKKFTASLKGDELDPALYMIALSGDIAHGVTDPCYNVSDNDKIEPFCFHVIGKETLDTALGKLATVVVERVRKPESPRHTQFWFAPSLDYTIAKLEHQEERGKNAYSLEITYYKRENSK